MEMLAFCNKLYRKGLLDPASAKQSFSEMSEKTSAGGVFCSVFSFAGSDIYNTKEHLLQDRIMCPLPPEEAVPLAYGLNLKGNEKTWTIGAATEYPELCMAIIDYLSTPDGVMEYFYGPKSSLKKEDATDGCWYYKDGKTFFTGLGRSCREDFRTAMPAELGGGIFVDGLNQINNLTLSLSATNPVTGERYDCNYWESQQPAAANDSEKQYRIFMADRTNAIKIAHDDLSTLSEVPEELSQKWERVAKALVSGSWKAIYAASEEEYEKLVSEMTEKCRMFGYEECVGYTLTQTGTGMENI